MFKPISTPAALAALASWRAALAEHKLRRSELAAAHTLATADQLAGRDRQAALRPVSAALDAERAAWSAVLAAGRAYELTQAAGRCAILG
jgi:hypothetical protein